MEAEKARQRISKRANLVGMTGVNHPAASDGACLWRYGGSALRAVLFLASVSETLAMLCPVGFWTAGRPLCRLTLAERSPVRFPGRKQHYLQRRLRSAGRTAAQFAKLNYNVTRFRRASCGTRTSCLHDRTFVLICQEGVGREIVAERRRSFYAFRLFSTGEEREIDLSHSSRVQGQGR